MQAESKIKILQKVPLKSKLVTKATIHEDAEMLTCRFGLQDMMVACGYSDGRVRIFNLNTGNKISDINSNEGNMKTPVNALRWRPVNQESNVMGSTILVANTDGNLYQYVAKTGKEIFHTKEEGNYIMAVDYTTEGLQFATAGKDNIVRLYDQETKKVIKQLKAIDWHKAGHNNRLFSLKFKPDQPYLLCSGGWDQNVNIWDTRQGSVVSSVNGPKIAGDSIDIRGDLLLTGANRGTDQLQLWDWRNKKQVVTFKWDQEKHETSAHLFCCQFAKHSTNSVIAVGHNQMKMFSLDDFSELLEVKMGQEQSLYSCDSSSTNNKYILGGKSGNLVYLAGLKTHQ